MAWVLPGMAAVDYYGKGKVSYKAGRYDTATTHFLAAVKQDPNHAESHFYLGLSYARIKQYEKARGAFQRVIEIENMKKFSPDNGAPNQVLIDKAQKNLAVMTKSQIAATGNTQKAAAIVNQHAGKNDNYLAYAIPNGKVIHWDTAKMPLKIYIQSGQGVEGWDPSMNSMVMNAADSWYRASAKKISFKETKVAKDADIVVKWRKVFSHDKVGVNAFRNAGDTILQSDVHLATYHPAGRPLTPQELQGTAIHELGHALGIQGHSPYPGDIMFFSQTPMQSQTLTYRDEKTIQLLYKQQADITNNTAVSTTQAKQVYTLLSKANGVLVSDPEQALNYTQQALAIDASNDDAQRLQGIAYHNTGVRYLNEGVAAAKNNNRALAQSKFRQALQIFESVSRSANPPQGIQQSLSAARQNLDAVSH